MNITLNGKDLDPILASNPTISDQLESVCRTLEFSVWGKDSLDNKLGQTVELWYRGKRWFVGVLRKRGRNHNGIISYLVYDPMVFLIKNIDDFYFSGQTAKQGVNHLAKSSGIKVHKLADTKAVLPPLYYQGAAADKVAIDLLVRTYQANKKKFWIRYNPGHKEEGLDLFDRIIPEKLWAFQVGINLTGATMEESIEETITVVKLVNRNTGKIVTAVDEVKLKAFGKSVHFEEIDKDKVNTMEIRAKELLDNLSGIALSQQIEGINPDSTMPQLFSGDFIYVEEKNTNLMGGYHIRNITQTFVSDKLITISADIEKDASVPAVQFEDATKDPNKKKDEGAGGGFTPNDDYLTDWDDLVAEYEKDKNTSVSRTPGSPGYKAPEIPKMDTSWNSYLNNRLSK